MKAWLTVEEVAPRLGVHPRTFRRWCRNGTPPASLIARRWGMRGWRISVALLEQLERGELWV